MTITSSIDPREVDFYRKLADTWWDESGPFWPLHRLNRLRIAWIVRQLDDLSMTREGGEPLSDLHVLDVGCGGGILSESLAFLGARVTAIDVVEKNILTARTHAESTKFEIDYQKSTAEQLAETGAQFDVVFNMEVVEHVADLEGYLTACHQLVRPGGATFIATINRNPYAWLVAIFGAEYILRWLPRGTHRYHLLRKPEEIRAQLSRDDFRVSDITGVAVNPLNRTMQLSRSTLVNYMLCATKGESPT